MVTVRALCEALGVHNNQRWFTTPEDPGSVYPGSTTALVLAALSNRNHTPSLNSDVRRVAYAIHKFIFSGRMPAHDMARIRGYKISRLCRVVVQVHTECYDKTVDEIINVWLTQHYQEL